jgi:hypothetical protein
MTPSSALMAVVVVLSMMSLGTAASTPAQAVGCNKNSLTGNLIGEGDGARISLRGYSVRCSPPSAQTSVGVTQPHYTYEVLCTATSPTGPNTLCSASPCTQMNQSFALRNIQYPDGRAEPAGWDCLNPGQAVISPGITLVQVYAAVRSVDLPGARIGVTPNVRGLANLQSFFWLEGANQPPVDLQVGGSTVHAEFRVVEYRWEFGEGEPLVTAGPGTPGLDSDVRTTFPRRGFYRVGVTVMWVAEAWLDGRRVGEVDDLVSRAVTTYPVAELRTVLTG